jgi:hypothetical protein
MRTVGAFIHEHHSLVRPTGFCSKIDATESRVKQTAAAEMKCMLAAPTAAYTSFQQQPSASHATQSRRSSNKSQ